MRPNRPAPHLVLLLLLVAAVWAVLALAPTGSVRGATASTRPNILLVVTDDQTEGTANPEIMPNVVRELEHKGTRFTNAFVTLSWCCPSRASILTGQYAHTTGVWTTGGASYNRTPWQRHENDTLATWLHDAGYRTGIVGKYMNWFGNSSTTTYHPPGWDTTAIIMGLDYQTNPGYYDYDLFENGSVVHYGTSPDAYSTRVFTRKAREFIGPGSDGKPWFLYLPYTAPHGPAVPDPLDTKAFGDLRVPLPPSVCESDVSDKPFFVRERPACSVGAEGYSRKIRQQQARPLASVDRGLGAIFADLEASGQLANTLILLISDNGHTLYHHRLRTKQVVYEPSIRVPILARWDALGSPPARRPEFALNIDLAPTVAEATGLTNHNPFDGRSLLPLMRGESPGWRDDFLVEHKATTNEAGPSFCAVRGSRWKFVQYQTGERELYDLSVDPDEMTSLHGRTAYREVEDVLHARMLELCSPPPPGWTPQ